MGSYTPVSCITDTRLALVKVSFENWEVSLTFSFKFLSIWFCVLCKNRMFVDLHAYELHDRFNQLNFQ